MILVQLFSDTGRISNVNHLSYLLMVHPIQGLDLLWYYLCLIFLPCLLLFQELSQQLIYGCHDNDVVLNALGFFQDSGFGTPQTPISLHTCFSMQMVYLHSAPTIVYLSQ